MPRQPSRGSRRAAGSGIDRRGLAGETASPPGRLHPRLGLGILGDAVMALMLGALPIHGIVPGPQVIARQPDLFWGLIASFWIGNVLLAILNLPLIGLWIRILQIPYRILYSSMLFFICVVVYSISNNVFDIFLILFFGVIGCGMMVLGFPAAPLLLGVLLSPSLEQNLRRALLISRGDLMTFLERPISAVFLATAPLALVWSLRATMRRRAGAADRFRSQLPRMSMP